MLAPAPARFPVGSPADGSANDDRGNPVIPRVPAAKRNHLKIGYAAPKAHTPTTEVPVIEHPNPGTSKHLNRRDIVAKVARQLRKPIPGAYAKVVSSERRCRVEAGSVTRIGTPVPRWVPGIVLRPISPVVIRWRSAIPRRALRIGTTNNSNSKCQNKESCNTLHRTPPWVHPSITLEFSPPLQGLIEEPDFFQPKRRP